MILVSVIKVKLIFSINYPTVMRTSDMRSSSTNDNSSVRISSNIQYIPEQPNPAQNIFYQPIQISPQIANGSHFSNYLYPSLIPMPNHQQMMMSGNQQLLIPMPNMNRITHNQTLGSIKYYFISNISMNFIVSAPEKIILTGKHSIFT